MVIVICDASGEAAGYVAGAVAEMPRFRVRLFVMIVVTVPPTRDFVRCFRPHALCLCGTIYSIVCASGWTGSVRQGGSADGGRLLGAVAAVVLYELLNFHRPQYPQRHAYAGAWVAVGVRANGRCSHRPSGIYVYEYSNHPFAREWFASKILRYLHDSVADGIVFFVLFFGQEVMTSLLARF